VVEILKMGAVRIGIDVGGTFTDITKSVRGLVTMTGEVEILPPTDRPLEHPRHEIAAQYWSAGDSELEA
jgi:hypothetical protein